MRLFTSAGRGGIPSAHRFDLYNEYLELVMRCALILSLVLFPFATVGNYAAAQEEATIEVIAAAEPVEDESQATATPAVRPLTVATGLTDDTTITGTLMDSTSLNIKTAFGVASIPLSEVAGIRFPAADDASTTVVMLNGDSITGATDLKFVSVETTWGSAKINGQNIATMLFVPGLAWQSATNLGGKRWMLVETARDNQAQSSANPVQPASGSRMLNNQLPQVPPGQPRVIYGR